MSKVDVLGLLDSCNASLDAANIGWPSAEEIAEGRDAITELIEASRGVQPFMSPSSGDPSCEGRATARFDAALAKVRP